MNPRFGLCLMFLWALVGNAAVYQSREEFLQGIFGSAVPAPKILWITKSIKKKATKILSHRIGFLRTRYWETDGGTVWILDEIGKTKPITVGVVVTNGHIGKVKVLAFRESRGWEVKQEFFTEQFFHAGLNQWEVGFNYWPHEDVVVKFDYRNSRNSTDADLDYEGIDIGLGYQF